MTRHNRYTLIPVLLGFALLLGSCGKKTSTTHSLRDAKGDKKYGGTFNLNETGDLRSLEPPQVNDQTSNHISENIYDRLLEFDEKLNLVPGLASLPTISADGLTYTFRIRNDVYFQDDPCFPDGKGRKMTSHDIVYCWTRALDPSTNTLALPYFQVIKGAKEYFDSHATLKQGVVGLQAPDDTTFVVTLTKPWSPFVKYTTVGNAFIYAKEAVEKYGKDFSRHGVGTGPYQFVDYKEAQYCILKRNPHYWQHDAAGNQLPYLDTLKFTFIKDNKTELLNFKQNKLDHVYRIPNEFFTDVVGENKEPKGEYAKYKLVHLPTMAVQYYGFTTTRPGVNNVHLRRAFAYAVDRNKIIKYILKGQAAGPGVHGLVPPAMPGYPIDQVHGFSFNPDSAHAELEIARKELGGTIPDLTLYLNSGGGRNEEVAQAIQQQLKENLGVQVGLQVLEWSQLTPKIEEGKADFWRLGWIADYPDPQNFLNLLYGKNVPPTGPSSLNSTRYKNPEFDRLYDAAIAATTPDSINSYWAQAENLAMRDAPMIVLYYDEDYHLLQPWVRDFPTNAMYTLPMKYCWFAE